MTLGWALVAGTALYYLERRALAIGLIAPRDFVVQHLKARHHKREVIMLDDSGTRPSAKRRAPMGSEPHEPLPAGGERLGVACRHDDAAIADDRCGIADICGDARHPARHRFAEDIGETFTESR